MPQIPATLGESGIGLFGAGMTNFYANKSVLPSWKFVVYVTTDNDVSTKVKTKDGDKNVGGIVSYAIDPKVKLAFSRMRYHHVVDVSIPLYKFKREIVKYGPVAKSFPMLEHEGFEIKVTYEDDRNGDVLGLIHTLQKTVVREDGYYKKLNENKVGDINIHLYNHFGINVCQWIGKNAYYAGADDVSLSYGNDDTLKYGITFACDTITFRKNTIIPAGVQNAIGVGLSVANDVTALGQIRR